MKKARLMIIASMAIFGTLGPFVRNISVSSGELALYRAVLASLLIGGYLLITGQKLELRKSRRELICAVPALFTLAGCLLSAVNGYFRYAMPLYISAPLLLWLVSRSEKG